MVITRNDIPVIKQIAQGRQYLDGLANKYILRSPTLQGIAGFVFDYEGDTNVAVSSDITDHYAENNTAYQDHIALRPTIVTLRGFVSELVRQKPRGLVGALAKVNSRLETVEAYLGEYTPQMTQDLQAVVTAAQDAVDTIDRSIDRAENLIGLFTGAAPGQTRQSQAYQELVTAWETKQIFALETPYRILENMTIMNLTFVQPEDSRYQSDISITLKQMRFASVEFTKIDSALYAGRAAAQKPALTDKGKIRGTPELKSKLLGMVEALQ